MSDIAVLGREEFTLGFALTGIRKIINVDGDAKKEVQALQDDNDVKIVIIDDHILKELSEAVREDITNSVQPVFVSLGTSSEGDNLRKLIKKSIGVDLWKEGE